MIKILIVEDEAGIRNSLAKAFPWHEMGCELIDVADSGISALAMCMKNQPDIIISPTFRTLKNELLAQLLLACWMNQ
jgi:YesN/AraC family two-component response regulator